MHVGVATRIAVTRKNTTAKSSSMRNDHRSATSVDECVRRRGCIHCQFTEPANSICVVTSSVMMSVLAYAVDQS